MKRRIRLVSVLSLCCVALSGAVGQAKATTQTRICPFPVVGGDPDFVQLSGPAAAPHRSPTLTYTAVADESPGEDKHVVALTLDITSPDGGQSSTDPANGSNAGTAPTTITLTLQRGHHFTIAWTAAFDFGIHPCSSSDSGQTPFSVAT